LFKLRTGRGEREVEGSVEEEKIKKIKSKK
jgi:hypothetical protein